MGTSRQRALIAGAGLLALAGCAEPVDFDLRGIGGGLDTSSAARVEASPRPEPDSRGVISYPNYQVVVARRGDTVADVANRIGIDEAELGRFNGIATDAPLRRGEILALPRRLPESAPGGEIDIATLAGEAIDRAPGTAPDTATDTIATPGDEPVRHQVRRGETAFSIARLYGVPVQALAEWNGLSGDFAVREGQYLLIPSLREAAPAPEQPSAPGTESPAPAPPSADEPLPAPDARAEGVRETPPAAPPSEPRAASGDARMILPANGSVIRAFAPGRNEGIDIGAPAGSPVRAADAGTVAAITQSTEQVSIIVIRHADNLLTVYANVTDIAVERGTRVSQGQRIAAVPEGSPSFVRFEVRDGFEAVDPTPFIE